MKTLVNVNTSADFSIGKQEKDIHIQFNKKKNNYLK